MRILYISKETPMAPVGGISTYLSYIVPAMRAAGHDVYLFTWAEEKELLSDESPFPFENTWIRRISPGFLSRAAIHTPKDEALATALLPDLLRCIDLWQIDVIEATDYLSPASALFSHMKSDAGHLHRLCVTYHHGFLEDFMEQDHDHPSVYRQNEFYGERLQCRVSDLVIAPSQTALKNLRCYGILTPAQVIREPYLFGPKPDVPKLLPEITYMGRISLSKGIDKILYLANAIHDRWPLEQIACVGTEVPTHFRIKETRRYMSTRVSPELATKIRYFGHIPRKDALALLKPGQLAPHLGSADTFSYACVESLDNGLMPIVRHGTAMAEFFPENLQHLVFPQSLGTPAEIQQHHEKLLAAGPEVVHELREYNTRVLDPQNIARQMGETYSQHLHRKRTRKSRRSRATHEDVTFLIPAYKPDASFTETIDSIASQCGGQPRVIICNDGSPQASTEWFDYARMRLNDCRIFNQPNGGLLAARNCLVNHLETPLAVFMDTDDLLTGKYLSRVLEAYNENPDANAVITERWNFDEDCERVIRQMLGDHLHFIRNDYRMTALIEKEVLGKLPFDSLRRNGEADDWDFWLRFHGHGYQAAFVPEPLFRYRFRTNSMSWPWSTGQSNGTNAMLKDAIVELLGLRPELAQQVAKALSLTRNF